MSTFASGKNGGVSGLIDKDGNGTYNAKIVAWRAGHAAEEFETTGYGDTDPEFETGLVYSRGVATGFFQTGNAPSRDDLVSGTSATLTLTANTGKTYSGTAIINNIQMNHQHHGAPVGLSFSYVFSGAVTETW